MKKSTVITIIVVIFALIVVRGVQEIVKNRQKARPGGDFVSILPEDTRAADIQKLEIYRGEEKKDAIVLERSKDGWAVPSRFGAKGNEGNISNLLNDIKKLSGELRTKKASLHEDFGITAKKAVHISLYDRKGKLYQDLLLGKRGERGTEGFVRLASSNKVYLADKNLLSNLGIYGETDNPDAKKWLELKMLDKKKEEMAKVALDMPGKQVVLEKKEKKKEEKPEETPEESETPPTPEEKKGEKKEYEWVLASPPTEFQLKEPAVNSLVSSVSQLNAEDIADPAKMNEYGFDASMYTATITMDDGSIETLLVGKKTDKDNKRYARLKDGSTIYILPQYTVTGVFKKMRDLLEIKIWDLKREEVASISLQRPEYEIVMERRVRAESKAKEKKEERDYEWVLVKPETRFKLEDYRTTSILSKLVKPSPDDLFLTGEPQTYGLDSPEFKAVMTMKDNSVHTLLFGKKVEDGEERYVKFEGKDHVYSFSKYDFEGLFPKLPKLVSVDVMRDLQKNDIVSLKYHTPNEDFAVNRKEGAPETDTRKWSVKTEKEESDARSSVIDDVLDAVTGIRGDDLIDIVFGKSDADCGLDAPSETLSISTRESPDKYVLLFGKKVSEESPDRYFKIKDQPEIFVFSGTTFSSIFKKAKDIAVEKAIKPKEPGEKAEKAEPTAPPKEPEKTEPTAPKKEAAPAPEPEGKKEEKPASPEEQKPAPETPTEKAPLERPKEEIPAPPIPEPPTPREPIPLPSTPESK